MMQHKSKNLHKSIIITLTSKIRKSIILFSYKTNNLFLIHSDHIYMFKYNYKQEVTNNTLNKQTNKKKRSLLY